MEDVIANAVEPPANETGSHYELHGSNGDILAEAGTDAFLRMQALLAQWLRMENVVVLLGAGASVSRGGPLLGALERDVLQAVIELSAHDETLAATKQLVEERLAEHTGSNPAYNFEKWLTFLTNAHCIATSDESPIEQLVFRKNQTFAATAISYLITTISRLIFIRCSIRLPSLVEMVTGHHAFFAKLVSRDPSLGRVHVFSTNYDTLAEQALEDLGIHYTDGFVGRVRARFDPASYGLDLYYPGEVAEGRVRRFDKFLHLYKPHGSINWRRPAQGPITQIRDPQLAIWESWTKMETTKRGQYLSELFVKDGDPIGIIPTENKFVQTLGMPYAHLFRAFHSHLQNPQTFVLVIGYSFGDPHINAIIDDAMTNPSLVMLVVDPCANADLKKRIAVYQRTGERVFLLSGRNPVGKLPEFGTFDDFSTKVLPQVKWIDDFVKLRKVERDILTLSSPLLPKDVEGS